MGIYAVTGGSSGIGAKTVELLKQNGHEVLNIDLRGGDITADLSKQEGREHVISELHRLCPDGLDGLIGVENFDQSLAEGVMLLTPFAADAQDDLTQKFVSAYKDKYGETPIQFAADAYDAIYAIKLAAEKENVTPDMSVSDICEAMKKGMTEISLEGLTGTITWTASGEPDKEPKAVKIENGAYTAME